MADRKLQLPKTTIAPVATEFKVANPAQGIPGVEGTLPVRVGQILRPSADNLTDKEKAVLYPSGWKDGDPVPANLADIIRQTQAASRTGIEPPVPIDTPPLAAPREASIEDLDPAHQDEIRSLLMQANAAANTPPLEDGPGLEIGKTIEVLDDVTGKSPATEKPSIFASGKEVPAMPIGVTHCPHCYWDLSVPDIADPDEDEKLWYLQGLLGNQLFERTLPIIEGHVYATYVELNNDQVDHIYRQIGREIQQTPHTEQDFAEKMDRYRLAMQLRKIKIGIEGMDFPNSREEGLPDIPALWELMKQEAIKSSTMGRNLIYGMRRFNRLVAKLEACAERENFWPAAR